MSLFVRARILPSSNPSSEPGASVRSALSFHHVTIPCHKISGTYARAQHTPLVQYCVQESESNNVEGACIRVVLLWKVAPPVSLLLRQTRCGEPASTTFCHAPQMSCHAINSRQRQGMKGANTISNASLNRGTSRVDQLLETDQYACKSCVFETRRNSSSVNKKCTFQIIETRSNRFHSHKTLRSMHATSLCLR